MTYIAKYRSPCLPVFATFLYLGPMELLTLIGRFPVLYQPSCSKLAFRLRKKSCSLWIFLEDVEGKSASDNCDKPFYNKDPGPKLSLDEKFITDTSIKVIYQAGLPPIPSILAIAACGYS